MSDVERIAQAYSHTLRSDLIAELNRLRAKERSMLAALARRDAAIQAVRALCDEALNEARNLKPWPGMISVPITPRDIPIADIRAAIATELEKP